MTIVNGTALACGTLLWCDGCTAHVDMREQVGYIVELMPAPKQ